MDLKKLQNLKGKMKAINKSRLDTIENSERTIKDLIKTINHLSEQRDKIQIECDKQVLKLALEEKSVMAEYESELAKFDIYGTYTIYSLLPVLADLTKRIEEEEVYFRTIEYKESAETVIDSCKVYYHIDVLTLIGKKFQFVVAESPKPTKIDTMRYGEGYASKTYFDKDHKFATYDCELNAFNFVNLGSYISENTPTYIKDFICYVSNYRLKYDLKEIRIDKLKELEDKFLEENRERYQGQARNLKK